MTLRVTILAALALVAFEGISAAEGPSQGLLVKVADQVGVSRPLRPKSSRHYLPYHRWYGASPVACESVIFPRSPLCAGRPATFGPYAPFPWNVRWYY